MKNYNDVYDKKQRVCAMMDEAYSKGYDTACDDCEIAIQDSYQKGLDDAWECTKKIGAVPSNGGFTGAQLKLIFNQSYVADIVADYSASEAIAKIKEYEEKQKADKEIKVGDEIIDSSGNRGVVVALLEYEDFRVLWLDGTVSTTSDTYKKKTGRHFDIENILDQMRNEQ